MTMISPAFGVCISVFLLSLPAPVTCVESVSFNYDTYPSDAGLDQAPHQKYVSTNETSPLLQVNTWQKDKMSKHETHIFLRHSGITPKGTGNQSTPLILRADDLTAVYMDRTFPCVYDTRVQMSKGKDYLAFFGGPCPEVGFGNGANYVYDTSYNLVQKVVPQNLTVLADFHEFRMNGDGSAILTAYDMYEADVSMIEVVPGHGDTRADMVMDARGYGIIRDSIFQELDLETNEVLFQWRASDHIPLTMSVHRMVEKWDWFHINSVEKTKNRDYLVSGRHTNSIYLINGKTGSVIWTLGGKGNDFKELPAPEGVQLSNTLLSMKAQHHARFYPGNEMEITVFDNHALSHSVGCEDRCSRGIHLRIDTSEPTNMTAQILNEYLHPKALRSGTQGSMQVLENGNILVGWGGNPSITEHTKNGECVFDAQFSPWHTAERKALDNYRAYRQAWTAEPYWDPTIATTVKDKSMTAWLSWNGATEVHYWKLYVGSTASDLLRPLDSLLRVPRSGFETAIQLGNMKNKFLRAAALNANLEIIRYSAIHDMTSKHISSKDELAGLQVHQPLVCSSSGQSGELDDPLACEQLHRSTPANADNSRQHRIWQLPMFSLAALAGVFVLRLMHRQRAWHAVYRRIYTRS